MKIAKTPTYKGKNLRPQKTHSLHVPEQVFSSNPRPNTASPSFPLAPDKAPCTFCTKARAPSNTQRLTN